jgi:hypothetical protein
MVPCSMQGPPNALEISCGPSRRRPRIYASDTNRRSYPRPSHRQLHLPVEQRPPVRAPSHALCPAGSIVRLTNLGNQDLDRFCQLSLCEWCIMAVLWMVYRIPDVR